MAADMAQARKRRTAALFRATADGFFFLVFYVLALEQSAVTDTHSDQQYGTPASEEAQEAAREVLVSGDRPETRHAQQVTGKKDARRTAYYRTPERENLFS